MLPVQYLYRSIAITISALLFGSYLCTAQVKQADYLKPIKDKLVKQWPDNRSINLVFHGHSVPSGYTNTPFVNTLGAYPYLLLKELKAIYPYAVINVIVTAIGGENSVSGAKRFKDDVLIYKPDVLFIDYALNDMGIGMAKAREATGKMVEEALKQNIKVILLTPSPDQRINILERNNALEQFSDQIKSVSAKYAVGVADSFGAFRDKAGTPDGLKPYMGWVNHPNEKGHQLIAGEILKWF
ncbi:SGNH/GDSL hydrolase family protein [Pedobacter metabolipauper]|uniref:Lysophospholipase L1-like esterase n=1 Tax=Pedobacter metabolipauper TaxID=425513 RepID=A0A4R6SRT9_9SPHI|nr:GDSL-type esterase/lipase family protein [Pedobacter metabolipauper]TDQ06944.1 lysophospholipase L1-like esterase [Pedobacter metabolipauper]